MTTTTGPRLLLEPDLEDVHERLAGFVQAVGATGPAGWDFMRDHLAENYSPDTLAAYVVVLAGMAAAADSQLDPPLIAPRRPAASGAPWPGPCPCECNRGGFCGGCGHAGCAGRR